MKSHALLSPEEKLRFVEYLEMEERSAKAIEEQLRRVKGAVAPQLIENEKTLSAACRVLIDRIKSGERK